MILQVIPDFKNIDSLVGGLNPGVPLACLVMRRCRIIPATALSFLCIFTESASIGVILPEDVLFITHFYAMSVSDCSCHVVMALVGIVCAFLLIGYR